VKGTACVDMLPSGEMNSSSAIMRRQCQRSRYLRVSISVTHVDVHSEGASGIARRSRAQYGKPSSNKTGACRMSGRGDNMRALGRHSASRLFMSIVRRMEREARRCWPILKIRVGFVGPRSGLLSVGAADRCDRTAVRMNCDFILESRQRHGCSANGACARSSKELRDGKTVICIRPRPRIVLDNADRITVCVWAIRCHRHRNEPRESGWDLITGNDWRPRRGPSKENP